MDEFEVEVRLGELEKVYSVAVNAVRHARAARDLVLGDPTASAAQMERAKLRCAEVERRHLALRRSLDELESLAPWSAANMSREGAASRDVRRS